jgi:hypothetical protein
MEHQLQVIHKSSGLDAGATHCAQMDKKGNRMHQAERERKSQPVDMLYFTYVNYTGGDALVTVDIRREV